MINVDAKGSFNFKVYGDFKYEIRADIWGKDRGQSDRLLPKDKAKGLTLTLKRGQ